MKVSGFQHQNMFLFFTLSESNNKNDNFLIYHMINQPKTDFLSVIL